jgi:hypothetical protein
MKQGDAEELLYRVLVTLFVLSVNQEQFKDRLCTIYSESEWPKLEKLQDMFYIYSENTLKMSDMRKTDGRINANSTTTTYAQPISDCENCGSKSHNTKACTSEPNTCFYCGKIGHLQKYCRKRIRDTCKPTATASQPRKETKKSARTVQRKKLFQTATANKVILEDETDSTFDDADVFLCHD